MFVMQCELVVLLMLWAVVGMGVAGPSIQSNFNISSVNDYALVSTPLEVPLSLLRNSDPIAHTPIIQKYYINLFRNNTPDIDISDIKTRMLQVDHQMLFSQQPPATFFESKNIEEYHLLESMEFSIMLSNPSELFTVCLIEVFSDCESIKRAIKRPLPLCINPYTKYPLHFNIYVTAAKNRQAIHSAIFFNATIKHQGRVLTNRIWKRQVSFSLQPNHLKLYSFQLRNCKQEHSVISIKNPQKHDLSLLIVYKHKKLYMNNQPFDEKVLVAAGKTFRFMIQGRDATMTIYTSNPEEVNRKYPILYVPLYCQQYLSIEYIPLGILSSPNLALTYPILVTSHSSSHIQITEIELRSSSQAVQLIKSPSHKIIVQPNDKFSQIGSFVLRASKFPSFKNIVSIRITCKSNNNQKSSQTIQITRTLTYTQLYNVVTIGHNRFYDVTKLKDGQYTQIQKIEHFNYTITNRLQIPIRVQRILFNSQKFRMHWFKFSRSYIYPNQQKQQILLEYIGPKNLPLSPLKYIAVIELAGGIFIPFETLVYDNTLTCVYQGKEDRCSKLKVISFGYQKSDQEMQIQNITIKNHNPTNITFQLHPYSLPNKKILNFTVRFESPFPFYDNSLKRRNNKTIVELRSGHTISMIIQVKVNKKVTGDMSLLIQTPYQKFSPRLRFHFESGKLAFTPEVQQISQCDLIQKGVLNLTSTFQDSFTIREILSTSSKFQFKFNESQQYQPLQSAILPYVYNPYKEQNYTDECCGQDFVKNHFLNPIINGQEATQEKYEISVITSNEIEQKTYVKVKPFHNSLITRNKKQLINFTILKVNSGGHLCFNVSNPYPDPMKYSLYFLSHIVVQEPKDYFTYLKHVKRERTQTYFCIKNQARNLNFINPVSLKQLFRLQQKPTELLLGKDGLFGDNQPAERTNLSNNDYLNLFTHSGNQVCYKFSSVLYIKLLIESQVINDILQRYPFEYTEKLVEREYQHLQDTVFTQFYDQFYTKIAFNLEKYCSMPVFPIFRFCQHIPLKMASPLFNADTVSRKAKRYNRQYSPTRILSQNSSQQICYMLHGHKNIDNFSFQLVVANNYSKHDEYKAKVELVEPRIKMGDIAFEQNRKINHTTFLKHYFTSLYKALYIQNDISLLKQNGIKDKSNIVPLYFTGQDYDEQFALFKGQRYFQLINNSPIDIHFTHYGFQNKEKTRFFSGFTVEQVGVPENTIVLKGNSKSTFKIGFHVDNNFNLNITNPIFNKNINFYLYNDNHYFIHLNLVIKVVDNIIIKMKTQSERNKYQSQNTFGYILINLLSLGFICAVITQLKREEEQKSNKLKVAKEKMKKIQNVNLQASKNSKFQTEVSETQLKIHKFHKVLSPISIGSKVQLEVQKKNQPYCCISEQDLAFFKTLKIKEDRSIVSDSQSQPQFRLSQHSESDKLKTDQEEKSQISQSAQEIKNQHQESNHQKTQNNQQAEEQYQQDEGSQLEGSQGSLTESFLPDGISVCNEQIDIDDNMQFQFGFGKEKAAKPAEQKGKKGEEEYVYYNVFSSYNPLKKESNQPFPWMTQNDKKKAQRPKHRKQE